LKLIEARKARADDENVELLNLFTTCQIAHLGSPTGVLFADNAQEHTIALRRADLPN
jgi:hypothetical protein